MANSKLVVSDLDFSDIKDNLKKFLQSQSQFQDYDFEGSSFNLIRYTFIQYSLYGISSKYVNKRIIPR